MKPNVARQRPLGTAHRAVLRGLRKAGGTWRLGVSPPLWEGLSWTVTLLKTLALMDLVEELEADKEYRLTAQGEHRYHELVLQQTVNSRSAGLASRPRD